LHNLQHQLQKLKELKKLMGEITKQLGTSYEEAVNTIDSDEEARAALGGKSIATIVSSGNSEDIKEAQHKLEQISNRRRGKKGDKNKKNAKQNKDNGQRGTKGNKKRK